MTTSDCNASDAGTKQSAGWTVLSIVVTAGILFGVSGVVRGGAAERTDLYCNCDYGIDCGSGEACRTNTGCEQPPGREYAGKCVSIGK